MLSKDLSRAVLVGVFWSLAAGVTALGASTGCSSSSGSPAVSTTPAQTCPATIDDTVGKACVKEGTVCGPTYACGTTLVPITCTCRDGTFQCVDGSGAAFDGTTPPSCSTHPVNTSCPADENTANRASCTAQQIGQQCAYQPQCPGGTMKYDLCTCTSGTTKSGSQGLIFICDNSCSGGSGPVPDAGGPPPPQDSGSPPDDAGNDSAAASD